MLKTLDGIELELEIGQVITDPAECDLIGRTFSDGRKTGDVKTVEFTYGWVHGLLEPRLWFGQNYINIWQAYQVCQWCHSPMEWNTSQSFSWLDDPPVTVEVYNCTCCGRIDEQAQGNVRIDTSEILF